MRRWPLVSQLSVWSAKSEKSEVSTNLNQGNNRDRLSFQALFVDETSNCRFERFSCRSNKTHKVGRKTNRLILDGQLFGCRFGVQPFSTRIQEDRKNVDRANTP